MEAKGESASFVCAPGPRFPTAALSVFLINDPYPNSAKLSSSRHQRLTPPRYFFPSCRGEARSTESQRVSPGTENLMLPTTLQRHCSAPDKEVTDRV